MINPFGLILAFAIIVLGTSTRNYWLSVLAFFATILVYPEAETVYWMMGAFLVGLVWHYAAKELTSNEYAFSVILLVAAILAVTVGQMVIAFFLAMAMALLFVGGASVRTGKKVVNKGREEWKDVKESVPKAKGQFPSGTKEIEKMVSVLGGKTGEALSDNPKKHFASPKLGERISEGAKQLLDGLARIFK